MNLKIFFPMALPFLFLSCQKSQIFVQSEIQPVFALENEVSDSMSKMIAPFRSELNEKMDVVVGTASKTLEVGRPESLLSNFFCDLMLEKAKKIRPTDFSITNVGGLRKSIFKGEITIRNVYEVMPFDNLLVLIELKGADVLDLCDAIASVGGEGVSGLSFGIQNGKASNVLVGGKPVNKSRLYIIATSDYLSFGNDKLLPLARFKNIYSTQIQLRDLLLEGIRERTAKEIKISSTLDHRIYEK